MLYVIELSTSCHTCHNSVSISGCLAKTIRLMDNFVCDSEHGPVNCGIATLFPLYLSKRSQAFSDEKEGLVEDLEGVWLE